MPSLALSSVMSVTHFDFDSRWDEELVSLRQKRVMDQFTVKDELYSSSAYSVEPKQSQELICQQVCKNFPTATEATLRAVLG